MAPLQPPIEVFDGNDTYVSIETVEEDQLKIHGQRFIEFQRDNEGRRVEDDEGVGSIARNNNDVKKQGVLITFFESDRLGTGKHAFVGTPTIQYQRLSIGPSEFVT